MRRFPDGGATMVIAIYRDESVVELPKERPELETQPRGASVRSSSKNKVPVLDASEAHEVKVFPRKPATRTSEPAARTSVVEDDEQETPSNEVSLSSGHPAPVRVLRSQHHD